MGVDMAVGWQKSTAQSHAQDPKPCVCGFQTVVGVGTAEC